MNHLKLFLIGLTALCSIFSSTSGEKIINCYWGTWSVYRKGNGAFNIEHIDPKLCTHLSYSFMGINEKGEAQLLDTWLDLPSGLNNIAKTMDLKKINPKLKVMLVIGGWKEGSAKYSRMAADPEKRKAFVQSVLKVIEEYKFDGLDLDWEYPAQRDGNAIDKANFVTLLKEIYQALHSRGLLFGIAVGATGESAEISYELPEISKYLDFINVMTYDFVTGGPVGHNAPLRGQGVNNVEGSLKYWLSKGVPASKLVLGLPFYGHTFKLASSGQYKTGSPSNGPGAPGPYTSQPGLLGYNEICTKKDSYEYVWSEKESVPVLYNNNELISYDDVKSIGLKVDLANSLNLAGVMIWSIETDDFNGLCGTKNPLLKAVNNKMGKPQDMSSSGIEHLADQKSDAEEPSQPNQHNQNTDSGDCSEDGLFAHQSDCAKYIQCSFGHAYEMPCPSGLHFDASVSTCNWPHIANCE